MFCGNCGKQLSDGDKFCTACGTKVENTYVEPKTERSEGIVQQSEVQESLTLWQEIKKSKFLLINPILFVTALVLVWFAPKKGFILARLLFPFFTGVLAFAAAKRSSVFCFIVSIPTIICSLVFSIYNIYLNWVLASLSKTPLDDDIALALLMIEVVTVFSIYIPMIAMKFLKPLVGKYDLLVSAAITFLMTDLTLNYLVNYIPSMFQPKVLVARIFSFVQYYDANTPFYGYNAFWGAITLLVLWLVYRERKPKQKKENQQPQQ